MPTSNNHEESDELPEYITEQYSIYIKQIPKNWHDYFFKEVEKPRSPLVVCREIWDVLLSGIHSCEEVASQFKTPDRWEYVSYLDERRTLMHQRISKDDDVKTDDYDASTKHI